AIVIELGKEVNRQQALQQIVDSGGRMKFRDLGLTAGGRFSVIMLNDKDPDGQQMRNIWEDPRNRAGHSSAFDELSARIFAARGAANTLEDFVRVMANEDNMGEDGRLEVAEALLQRHQDYQKWLEKYRDLKLKPQ
ncbi:MAG: hypothetical protein DMF70_04990, partial [Acidobacteria bacterium]